MPTDPISANYDPSRLELIGTHCLECGNSQIEWATRLSIAPRYPRYWNWCPRCCRSTIHELDSLEDRHRLDDGRVGGIRRGAA